MTATFDVLHVIDDAMPHAAALNMAIDEALLELADAPTLRFYKWKIPSLSFGYFGRFAEVANRASQLAIVRRWTGGGIVGHESDFTYSFIIPVGFSVFSESPRSIYTAVHSAIARVLIANGLSATNALTDAPKFSEACFANPVRADVLIAGQKVAGAAQRRTQRGLLQQGSIQGIQLSPDFAHQFANALCDRPAYRNLLPAVEQRATVLASEKYATESWLKRR